MNERKLRKKFEELSIRVNKNFKIAGTYGATKCDAYRRIIYEIGKNAIPFIVEELPKYSYWLEAMERITELSSKGNNNTEKVLNWINWWEEKKSHQNVNVNVEKEEKN